MNKYYMHKKGIKKDVKFIYIFKVLLLHSGKIT